MRHPQFCAYAWEPLTMTWEEVADRVFRRDAAWLRGNLPADFPRPDPVYHLFYVEAVEAWARRHWGVATEANRPDAPQLAPGPSRGKEDPAEHERFNYSVSLLAKRWSCSQGKVRSLLAKGALPHLRVGTLVRVRGADVRTYEEQCRVEAKPAAATPSPKEIMAAIRCSEGFRRGQESARRSLARKPP